MEPQLKAPEHFADLEANGLLGHDPQTPKATIVWMFATYHKEEDCFYLWVKDDELNAKVRKYCKEYINIPKSKLITAEGEYTKRHRYRNIKLRKLSQFRADMSHKPLIAMHNGIKYDRIIMKDLMEVEWPLKKMQDTLILSKLSDADRFPGHGLKQWGDRFKVPKPDHEDWHQFSLEMIHRCLQDCYITYLTWEALNKELNVPFELLAGVRWKEAIKNEHKVAAIVAESEALGFPFHSKRARKALKRMKKHRDKLDEVIGFHNYLLTGRVKPGLSSTEFLEVFAPICDLFPKEWGHFLEGKVGEDEENIENRQGYGKPTVNIYKKDGKSLLANVIKWWAGGPCRKEMSGPYSCIVDKREYPEDAIPDIPEIVGPYTRVDYNPVSPTSNPQMVRLLQSIGWEPDEWTDKGNSKITESSVERFAEARPEFTDLKDRIQTQARITMMENEKDNKKGLLNLVLENGRITSSNDQIGALTHRSRHKKIVNIPGCDARWGALFRDCFTALPWDGDETFSYSKPLFNKDGEAITGEYENEEGKLKEKHIHKAVIAKGTMALIGCDAQALEARLLGAFMGDEDFINEVLHGDIHTVFWDTVREFFPSRGSVKGAEYAFIFGAAALKLGSMVTLGRDTITPGIARQKGWKEDKGGRWTDDWIRKRKFTPLTWKQVQDTLLGGIVINRFLKGLPALGKLVDDLKAFAKAHKFIIGLDGRRFKVRKAHAVLNLKIQSSGALVMKKALIYAYKRFKKTGIPWYLHCYYHDEFNNSVPPRHIGEAGKILEQSIRDAGEYFKLKCPMDASAAVGITWADVH